MLEPELDAFLRYQRRTAHCLIAKRFQMQVLGERISEFHGEVNLGDISQADSCKSYGFVGRCGEIDLERDEFPYFNLRVSVMQDRAGSVPAKRLGYCQQGPVRFPLQAIDRFRFQEDYFRAFACEEDRCGPSIANAISLAALHR